jgi:hypothetical protein
MAWPLATHRCSGIWPRADGSVVSAHGSPRSSSESRLTTAVLNVVDGGGAIIGVELCRTRTGTPSTLL